MSCHRLAGLVWSLAVTALLTACAADLADQDYRLGHPVAVEQGQLRAVFDRLAPQQKLSAFDSDRLRRLAAESLRRGAGGVTVTSRDEAFAQSLAEDLRDLGVAAVSVAGDARDEATVLVPVWTTRPPECGSFERGINPDPDNVPHSNWGCSLQRNLAVMVQNPADLARASPASGRDANRATDVLDKYGHGLATGSNPENVTAGSASTVGH
jgi:pilus assembly protein CpaD